MAGNWKVGGLGREAEAEGAPALLQTPALLQAPVGAARRSRRGYTTGGCTGGRRVETEKRIEVMRKKEDIWLR